MANEFTYRADHIGSLVVPAALSEARKRHAAGADALRDAENVAVEAAVAMQRQGGIGVTTDGGFRRADHAVISLDGSKLAKSEGAPLKALSKRPIKVAVPAARRAPGEMLEQALARAGIVKQEIEALIAAGVDYVQLDTPGYAGPGQVFDELLQLGGEGYWAR